MREDQFVGCFRIVSQHVIGVLTSRRQTVGTLAGRLKAPELSCSVRKFSMAMEFDTLMNTLQGGISLPEGRLLRKLASSISTGCIVEVGSFRGKSAVALAAGVRDRPEESRPPIYCIEPHKRFVGFYGGSFGPEDRGKFYQAMLTTESFREVSLVNLSSEQVTPAWQEPVGLAFIDGDHRYEGVRRDFEAWEPHVVTGGFMAFDDATDEQCGPHRLIREILASGRYVPIATVGKVVVLQKCASSAGPGSIPAYRRRILIATSATGITGGFLRFERVGRVWRSWGHEVAFGLLPGLKQDLSQVKRPEFQGVFESSMPVLTFEEAASLPWDATMVPGAGWDERTTQVFAAFKAPCFGIRIQHVLNDQSRRAQFELMNRIFSPHVVVFNNTAWPAGTFTQFNAHRFYTLAGAVDSKAFHPAPYRNHPLAPGRWVIGAQARKDPTPLLNALPYLPREVCLLLYGLDEHHLAESQRALVQEGRLILTGPLLGDDLARFYHSVDCVVSAETAAGWSNLSAEAMASGVPVVCTPHGTGSFARHMETALVMEKPDPGLIAERVIRLMNDPALCGSLAQSARKTIEGFSWENYGRELLSFLWDDGLTHYIHAPEIGLYGKWPLSSRLEGLEPVLQNARGASIIDFGSAEGVVAREFLKRGASLVHGFELDPARVAIARGICSPWKSTVFRTADLSSWSRFYLANSDLIANGYDIVLYLGIHHHLPPETRIEVILRCMRLARRFFVVRTPDRCFTDDKLQGLLAAQGFVKIDQAMATQPTALSLGTCHVFERRSRINGNPQ